jgi:hypothetical protein
MPSGCSRAVGRAEKPMNTGERNGRHVGTRTPDLYRVKVEVQQTVLDSKGVNNRRNRQNRNTRRNLLPNCYQNMASGFGGRIVGDRPPLLSPAPNQARYRPQCEAWDLISRAISIGLTLAKRRSCSTIRLRRTSWPRSWLRSDSATRPHLCAWRQRHPTRLRFYSGPDEDQSSDLAVYFRRIRDGKSIVRARIPFLAVNGRAD